jgi:uncharacterized membrane protein YidH (DUF202 family)
MSRYDPDSRDPGLAAERTDLAWHRSSLSLLAVGAALIRGIGQPPLATTDAAVGGLVFSLGLAVALLGVWHSSRSKRRGARRTTTADLLPITVGVALVGVAAFVVCAVSPS